MKVDIKRIIEQIRQSDDCDKICEYISETLFREIDTDDASYFDIGRHLLNDVYDDDTSDLFITICGWSFESLLKKAHIIRDYDLTFHEETEEANYVTVDIEGNEYISKCTYKPQTHEIVDIESGSADKNTEIIEECIEIDGRRFTSHTWDSLSDDDMISYWYGENV